MTTLAIVSELADRVADANRSCVEAESAYNVLRRRGLSHREANKLAGLSVAEREFYLASDLRWDAEERIRGRDLRCLDDVADHVEVLRRRDRAGFDVSADLARLALALLQPGSATDC
jgi:hypothetical protein